MIDGVFECFDEIVCQCIDVLLWFGYFIVFYCMVIVWVKSMIDDGGFDDGVCMECFDVVFVNCFFVVFDQWVFQEQLLVFWQVVFDVILFFFFIVFQYLEFGMNVYIFFDFGIVVEEVVGFGGLEVLYDDFNCINDFFVSFVDGVKMDFVEIWLFLCWFNCWLGGSENQFVCFGMDVV